MKNKIYLKSKHRIINLLPYSGKWVGFINDKPVVFSNDLFTLMEKIKKLHFPQEPSVMLVPRKNEGPYILLLV